GGLGGHAWRFTPTPGQLVLARVAAAERPPPYPGLARYSFALSLAPLNPYPRLSWLVRAEPPLPWPGAVLRGASASESGSAPPPGFIGGVHPTYSVADPGNAWVFLDPGLESAVLDP